MNVELSCWLVVITKIQTSLYIINSILHVTISSQRGPKALTLLSMVLATVACADAKRIALAALCFVVFATMPFA